MMSKILASKKRYSKRYRLAHLLTDEIDKLVSPARFRYPGMPLSRHTNNDSSDLLTAFKISRLHKPAEPRLADRWTQVNSQAGSHPDIRTGRKHKLWRADRQLEKLIDSKSRPPHTRYIYIYIYNVLSLSHSYHEDRVDSRWIVRFTVFVMPLYEDTTVKGPSSSSSAWLQTFHLHNKLQCYYIVFSLMFAL